MAVRRWVMPLAFAFWSHLLSAEAPKPEIRIEGVTGELRRNLQAQLSLADESCTSPSWRVQDAFVAAQAEIRKALRALGYYRPVIRSRFAFTPQCWQASFSIEPGAQVRLSQVDIQVFGEAANDPKFQAVLEDPPVKPGDPLHHGRYEDLKSRLLNLAEQRGYFDACWRVHKLVVDPVQNLAKIQLHLDSGPRYVVGEIHIQQAILDPAFVRRYLPLKPGDPYTSQGLTEAYQGLADSGYFQDVEIRPQWEQKRDRKIPLAIRLFPRKRHFFKLGIGFDTNTGPRLSLGYENRRLNRRGHRLQVSGRASPVRSELSGQYLIPWDDPVRETLSFQAGYLHEDTDTLLSDSAALGVRFLHPRGNWSETVGLDLSHEHSRVKGTEAQSTVLPIPSIQWTRIQADDRLRPKRGWKGDLSLKGGAAILGDPVYFLQAHAYAKGVYQLPWQGRIVSRIEAGATWTDRFANLPASLRFFAGGDTSIRGYGYKRLGPKNQDGEVIGGRYLGVVSLEYEQLFLQDFGAALFVDAGNAFTTLSEPIQIGAGIGVRWYSPVGPIRLDLAAPVNQDRFRLKVHVSMGPDL